MLSMGSSSLSFTACSCGFSSFLSDLHQFATLSAGLLGLPLKIFDETLSPSSASDMRSGHLKEFAPFASRVFSQSRSFPGEGYPSLSSSPAYRAKTSAGRDSIDDTVLMTQAVKNVAWMHSSLNRLVRSHH